MIIIKNDKEIDLMRIAGRIVAETLLLVEKEVKPGITTAELDRIAEEFITKHGAKPSFKGLYGFPASLCISVNEQVVHGIPGRYVLKEGDIVSVDCGAMIDGYHGDAARTFAVGNISEEAQKLVLDPKKPVFVAAQTTFHYIKFQNIVDQLEKKEYNINCVNTICNATRNRQEEAASLAASVDGMLVIGGSHSSNTQKLFEICKKECNNTHYIQTAEDLDTNWFLTADRVGVTGGASTPNIIIEEVLHHVRRIRTIIK